METQVKESDKGDTEMSRASTLDDTWKIRFHTGGQIKTAFVIAKDHKRAERLAQAYPNVIGVSKARRDFYRIADSELHTLTNEMMKDIAQPKMTPLAMDEFLWMRRKKRIDNKNKDKKDA